MMFQTWRTKLKEAEEALKNGRLDETCQLINSAGLSEYLPGQKLQQRLAQQLVQRALHHGRSGNFQRAWKDYQQVCAFHFNQESCLQLKKDLIDIAIKDILHQAKDDPANALKKTEQLRLEQPVSEQVIQTEELLQRYESARHLARRGKFTDALEQIDQAIMLQGNLSWLTALQADCQQKQIKAKKLIAELHQAMAQQDWGHVLSLSDQMLEISPEHRVARSARRQAWSQVGANIDDSQAKNHTHYWRKTSMDAEGDTVSASLEETLVNNPSSLRFILWIDAVGGYLCCLGGSVSIGQAVPGNVVDLPIFADLSKQHALIRREGEVYVLEPLHVTHVNGKQVDVVTLLRHEDEITLGSNVTFRF